MEATPTWALTIAFWLHMLATVVWIGGLAAISIFVLPAARKTLDAGAYAALIESIQRRLDPVGWLCLLVLVATCYLFVAIPKGFFPSEDTSRIFIVTEAGEDISFASLKKVTSTLGLRR